MRWLSASEGLFSAGRSIVPVITVAAAAFAGAVFVADHALKYNVAHLLTQEQLREQLQKQSEELRALRADLRVLRADLRVVPVLDGRTEELCKTNTNLVTARERRPWW